MTIKRLYGGAAGGEWELFLIENPTHEEMTRAWAARDDLFPPEFPTPTPDVSPVPPTAREISRAAIQGRLDEVYEEWNEYLNAHPGQFLSSKDDVASVSFRGRVYELETLLANLSAPPVAPTQLRLDLEGLLARVGKMRDDWADGDSSVKKELWRELHTFAGELEARYEILGREW